MPSGKPLIYLLLGAAGSGRREVLADLIGAGLDDSDQAAVLLADGEAPAPADALLPKVGRWTWSGDAIEATLPEGATQVFLVADGRRNPVDQVEAFAAWLKLSGGELGRILTVVHCRLAEQHHALVAWYEACVHFSDVALLNRREGVANKWMSDFLARLEKEFHPSLFELVKAGKVKNPALLLDPQARRVSHAFDEDQDWIVAGTEGEAEDEDDVPEGEEEVEMVQVEDPYFARYNGGHRVKPIPDIAKFLG